MGRIHTKRCKFGTRVGPNPTHGIWDPDLLGRLGSGRWDPDLFVNDLDPKQDPDWPTSRRDAFHLPKTRATFDAEGEG